MGNNVGSFGLSRPEVGSRTHYPLDVTFDLTFDVTNDEASYIIVFMDIFLN
jgi:hypothetical protein